MFYCNTQFTARSCLGDDDELTYGLTWNPEAATDITVVKYALVDFILL